MEAVRACCHSAAVAAVDRRGFWGALTGMLKRRRQQRLSTVEDGIYLEDIDSDSMDPEELSQFFPSRYNGQGTIYNECTLHCCNVLGEFP